MANGNFGGGDGSLANPCLVEDVYDLDAIRGDKNMHYAQVADIDMSGFGNWIPIGTSSNPFRGTYNGRGYKITNLTCEHSGADYISLFGRYVYKTVFSNIGLVNCRVVGRDYVGSIGSNGDLSTSDTGKDFLIFKNCYSTGDVSGREYVGGITGTLSVGNPDPIMQNCYSSCNVTGFERVGGLVGYCSSHSEILNSYALNPFIARVPGSTNSYFGDIVGHDNGAIIENCFSLDTLEFRQL